MYRFDRWQSTTQTESTAWRPAAVTTAITHSLHLVVGLVEDMLQLLPVLIEVVLDVASLPIASLFETTSEFIDRPDPTATPIFTLSLCAFPFAEFAQSRQAPHLPAAAHGRQTSVAPPHGIAAVGAGSQRHQGAVLCRPEARGGAPGAPVRPRPISPRCGDTTAARPAASVRLAEAAQQPAGGAVSAQPQPKSAKSPPPRAQHLAGGTPAPASAQPQRRAARPSQTARLAIAADAVHIGGRPVDATPAQSIAFARPPSGHVRATAAAVSAVRCPVRAVSWLSGCRCKYCGARCSGMGNHIHHICGGSNKL